MSESHPPERFVMRAGHQSVSAASRLLPVVDVQSVVRHICCLLLLAPPSPSARLTRRYIRHFRKYEAFAFLNYLFVERLFLEIILDLQKTATTYSDFGFNFHQITFGTKDQTGWGRTLWPLQQLCV